MDHEAFIDTAAQRSHIPREKAESLTHATLETLAERLTKGEADDLASELPKPLKTPLISQTPEAEDFGLEEFVDPVSRRSGLGPDEAREGVRAELSTLRDAVSDGEFRQVLTQLPTEFGELVDSRS